MTAMKFFNGALHRIKIEQDSDPRNPRDKKYNDNASTMVCWHRNYTLGDEQPKVPNYEYRRALAIRFDPKLESRLERIDERFGQSYYRLTGRDGERQWRIDYNEAIEKAVNSVLDKHIVQLPLYLYDHSGITMRTSSFSDRWDSGQVGFIYLTREKIQKEWGWKVLTPARREKLYSVMTSEVEEYAKYLEGDVYGFVHEKAALPEDFALLELLPEEQVLPILERNVSISRLDWDVEDSCWGFYGSDIETNGIMDYIPKGLEQLARAAA